MSKKLLLKRGQAPINTLAGKPVVWASIYNNIAYATVTKEQFDDAREKYIDPAVGGIYAATEDTIEALKKKQPPPRRVHPEEAPRLVEFSKSGKPRPVENAVAEGKPEPAEPTPEPRVESSEQFVKAKRVKAKDSVDAP